MTISQADLDALERGLEGVTPGPWGVTPNERSRVRREKGALRSVAYTNRDEDATHIARCDPDTIRELIRGYRIGREAEQGWQPIETAPRDGRHFLAVVEGEVRRVYHGKTSHVPLYGFCLSDQGPEDCDLCEPTRWRPLPTPPKTGGE
jgi:hypothetical protein